MIKEKMMQKRPPRHTKLATTYQSSQVNNSHKMEIRKYSILRNRIKYVAFQ